MLHFLLPPKTEYGFCSGVSSAIKKALAVDGDAYCLGYIVHNKNVVEQLTQKGIKTVDSVEDIPDGSTLIIRAHGAPPQVYARAAEKHLNVVDATCPYVAAIQHKAKKYFSEGYQIVLVGEATHPEIVGINGWCDNTAVIFDGKGQITLQVEKVLILFQTTFDTRFFEKSLKNISTEGVKTLEIFNTICYTTLQRQYYAQRLSAKCDLAVVVGDKRSSNTKRLLEIASQNCRAVLCDGTDVENIDLEKCRNVCFISGASTPSELIKGVLERMSEIAKEAVSIETEVSEQSKVNAAEAEAEQAAAPVAEAPAAEEPAAEEATKEVAEEAPAAEEISDKQQKVLGKDEAMMAEAVSKIKEGAKYHVGQRVKCHVVLVSEDGVYVRQSPFWKE